MARTDIAPTVRLSEHNYDRGAQIFEHPAFGTIQLTHRSNGTGGASFDAMSTLLFEADYG